MNCPVCSEPAVLSSGDKESDILFIGSEVSEDEYKYKKPFTGQTFHVFKKLLFQRAHIDLTATRQINLWYHPKCKGDCQLVSLEQVEKEITEAKFVILVGADAVKYFTGLSVDNCNGLDITSEVAEEMTVGGRVFFALCSPQSVFRAHGEMYFGLDELSKWYQENQ
jgi:uracil-DNA glycosylase